MALPRELQMELVEKAAAKCGNCQELAKRLNIPKSSVHYYRIGRLTMPTSVLERMLVLARDESLTSRVGQEGIEKDRSWATEYAQDVYREMCRDRVNLPTIMELEKDALLRRKAATIVSYVLTEGSVWMQKAAHGEHAANITFADHEGDLYDHFRVLCKEVFAYDIGSPQRPGNDAKAIRGFIYSRFVAEWLIENGVFPGDKAGYAIHLPRWVMASQDPLTWASALQPWCDGEGSVALRAHGSNAGFSIAQSRHTGLDFHVLPKSLVFGTSRRALGRNALASTNLFGIPALAYCSALYRSEVLSDVKEILERLGFHPSMKLSSMYLKDNGFWSANWLIDINPREAARLVPMRLVLQERKRKALEQSTSSAT